MTTGLHVVLERQVKGERGFSGVKAFLVPFEDLREMLNSQGSILCGVGKQIRQLHVDDVGGDDQRGLANHQYRCRERRR